MPPTGQYEHPFYNIAQNVFGGRARDEALQQHQADLALERQRQLLRMKQEEADRVADQEAQRLGTAMGAMAPSTTVRNPDQPGPVLQAPGLNIPGVTSPLAPPSLAETVFPGPSRATFGNEALRPQAAPGEPLPYPIKPPDQEWRDVYPEVPTPPVRPEPPETLGGATVAEPEVPQTPLPYTPAPYRAGGTREEVPGMTLDQLLREQPAVGRAYLGNRKAVGEVELADVETTGRKAVRDYLRARKGGMSEQDALDQYGEAIEASEVGRKFLTSIEAKQTKDIEQETKRRALAKETAAQQYLRARAAKLRESPDPKDQAKADLFETYAVDPKLAERLEAHEKTQAELEANRLKAEELRKKPIEIGGIGYRWATNAAGEPALQVIPGQQVKPEKSKWDGITATELDAMIENPATSPEDRAIAQRTIARVQQRELEKAAAGVPKPTFQSEKAQGERLVFTEALRESRATIAQHPEWVGGTGRAWVMAQAYDAPDPLKGTAAWLVRFPKGYDQFRTNLGMFTAEKLNELAGAALTAGEIKRYAAFLPSVYTTRERFMASVETSLKMMEAATAYHTAREKGATVAEAQTLARAAIRRVADEHVQKFGDPETTAPEQSAAGVAGQLNIPRVRP